MKKADYLRLMAREQIILSVLEDGPLHKHELLKRCTEQDALSTEGQFLNALQDLLQRHVIIWLADGKFTA